MRRALVAVGVLVMVFAVAGALTDHDVRRFGVLVFLVGVLVWHDFLVMPVVIAVSALVGRVTRKRSERPRARVSR
jgi:hypothetical protein